MIKNNYTRLFCLLLTVFVAFFSHANKRDSLDYVLNTETSGLERAKAHIELARLIGDTAPDLALDNGMSAYRLSDQLGDAELKHTSLQIMLFAFYTMGDYKNLLKYSLEALVLAESMAVPEKICRDHGWISSANIELGYTDKAIKHSKEALQVAKASRDSSLIAFCTLDMEAGYRVLGDHETGMQYCMEALKMFENMDDDYGRSFALQQIGRSYIDQEKYSDALPFSTKAMKLIEKSEAGTMSMMWSMQDMAEIHSGLNDLEMAEEYIAKAESIARDLGAKHDLAGVLESRSQLAEKRGDMHAALDFYKGFHELNDTLFNKDIAHQMASLQTVYDSEQREKENELLRHQNDLQQATITNQKLNNTLLILGGLVFFVLSFSFFFQFRSKLNINKKLREQNAVIQEQHDEIGKKNIELQRQNVRLAEAMVSDDEKKLLLKEIHHRVKNNLQIINSLLKMQSVHIKDKDSLKMFEECQGRVMSMALVHEQLYSSIDLSNVLIDEYIEKLFERSLGIHGNDMDIQLNLSCTVEGFPIDTLIPLGLLLNELLTNSLKHAFNDRHFGIVKIELDEVGNDVYRLAFSDDGSGMSEKAFAQGGSFGVDLIHTLISQLDGEVRMDNTKGTAFDIVFRQDEKHLKAAS